MVTAPSVQEAFAKIGLEKATRHLFLCLGPECVREVEGQKTWEYLKRRLSELNLPVLRTKAGCLRICEGGPWLVIYPDGIWYSGVTPERCERILLEHVRGGVPVADWVVATHELGEIKGVA
jgi:(2Fe-2S) ferredoxin